MVVDITCIFSVTAILHVLQHIPPMDGDQGGMGMEMLGLVDAVPMNKSFFLNNPLTSFLHILPSVTEEENHCRPSGVRGVRRDKKKIPFSWSDAS